MTTPTKLYTVQDFWKFIEQPENQHRKFELINGVIVEKMSPKFTHGMITSLLNARIFNYLEVNPIGVVVCEVDHYSPDDELNTRRPEISFISNERLKDGIDEADNAAIMPDLAIEVKSPNNTYKELHEKAEYYLKHGSRMVWNFLPEKEEVRVYTLAETEIHIEIVKKSGLLTGGDVLPGFTLPLAQVFKDKG